MDETNLFDPERKNTDGVSCLELATKREDVDIIDMLSREISMGKTAGSKSPWATNTMAEGVSTKDKQTRNSDVNNFVRGQNKERLLPTIQQNRFSLNVVGKMELEEESKSFNLNDLSKEFKTVDQSKIIEENESEDDQDFNINDYIK